MTPPPHQPPVTVTVLIYAFALALFVWRMSRPQRMSIVRLWVMPVLLVAVTAVSIYGSQVVAPAPPWEIAVVLAAGAILGIPLGMLRGAHSEVRPTERAGVMYVHSSPVVVLIWLAAFLLRAALRYLLPGANAGAGVFGDGLLAFAVSALITSYYAIYVKYRGLTQQAPAA